MATLTAVAKEQTADAERRQQRHDDRERLLGEEAERLAQETLAIGQRGQAENALHYYAQSMFNIRREQGRLAEVEGAVRGFIELYPAIPAWRSALALLLVELGRPEEARAEFERIAGGHFSDIPRDANWLIAITLLAGLQTVSPSLYEAATLDGASNWQRFRYITYPLLTPIIAVVMTFSVLFTFTDFQLIYVLTRGGPLNATHLMATLSFQRAIPGGALGEGAALATAMVPFLLAAILFSYFGLQRRAWQQGASDK